MKNCAIIYNPNSGRGIKEKELLKFDQILEENGYKSQIIKTEYKGHAKEIIKNLENIDLVISIGGDGTFNESMTGNFARKEKLLLAHLPIGTANDIGAMYGYGKDIVKNLKLLLSGEIKNIDICTINNEPFTYSAGFGKFINISYDTPRELKQKYGYLAYLIGGLKDFNGPTKTFDLTYKINGKTISGKFSFILISNANRIAGIQNFYKEVKLDDNLFEVLLCDSIAKKDFAKGFYYLKTSDIAKVPGFYFYKTDKMQITFNKPQEKGWSLDGEKYSSDKTVFNFKIVKNVQLLLPKKNISKLFLDSEI